MTTNKFTVLDGGYLKGAVVLRLDIYFSASQVLQQANIKVIDPNDNTQLLATNICCLMLSSIQTTCLVFVQTPFACGCLKPCYLDSRDFYVLS